MRFGRIFVCVLGLALCAVHPQVVLASSKAHAKHAVQAKAPKVSAAKHKRVAQDKTAPLATAKAVTKKNASGRAAGVRKTGSEKSELDAAGLPLIQSSAFYVQDVASGEVLLQKNSTAPLPIASITKLMTSMVVLDAHQNLGEVLEITEDDVDRLKSTSSHLGVGTRLTREELMHLALMASENRAASALARNYPGGMPAFLEATNAKARLMGLHETRFFDGTGLTKKNVSSARDLAIMVANASRYPLIREFSTSTEFTVPVAGGRSHSFHNTNALVKSPEWQIDVQKTGFINESGKCLVMQAWLGNKQLAIVLLDSWGKFTRLGDANRIRKWLEASSGRHHQVVSLQTPNRGRDASL